MGKLLDLLEAIFDGPYKARRFLEPKKSKDETRNTPYFPKNNCLESQFDEPYEQEGGFKYT